MYISNKFLTAAVVSALTSTLYAQQQGQPGQGQQQGQQSETQTYNGTILQLLNDTSISPAIKFSEFLYNSSDYQSIIDILNDTEHNVTFFLPSDQVYYDATGETPPTTSNAPVSSTTAAAAPGVASSNAAGSTTRAIGGFMSSIISVQSSRAAATQAPVQTNNQQAAAPTAILHGAAYYKNMVVNKAAGWEEVTTDATFADQFSYLDLIYYHLVNGSVELNQDNSTLVLNSLLTNESVVKVGSSAPLLVQLNNTATGNNSTTGNNAMENNSTAAANWTVGSGLEEGGQINQTFQTTNGIVYVINKILIPPVNVSDTLEQLNNTSNFTYMLNQANVSLDSQSNITVFAPTNEAIQEANLTHLDNQTLHNFIKAHILQGIYYTTNVTSNDQQPLQVNSTAGTNVTLTEASNNVTVDNIDIVKPNVLLNNGVLHLIDGVLNYTVAQPQNNGNNTSTTTGGAAPTRTSSGSASQTASQTRQPTSQTLGGQPASQTSDGGAFPVPTGVAADTYTLNLGLSVFSSIFVYLILSVF